MAKQGFPQTCDACGYKWAGKIPFAVSCPRCKTRRDIKRKAQPNKSVAVQFVEAELISSGYPQHMARGEAKRRLDSIIGFGGE